MATHLVIGDPHSTPKSPNDRFLWAGKFARDIKADVIICMGDFASMDSLSSYDKGKKSFEGRRYKKDIEHAHDALEKFNRGLLGNGRKKNGQRRIMLLGNHEDRIDRAIDNTPELDGAISIDDLEYDRFGWDVYNYQVPVNVDGVYYCHCFPNGVLGKAISGENVGRSLLNKNKTSSTVGHNHLLDYAISTSPSGKKLMGLSVGCFLNHEEPWAIATQRMWWSGLIVKRNVDKGEYDLETIRYNKIRRTYGKK